MKLYQIALLTLFITQGCKSKSNAAPPDHADQSGSNDSKDHVSDSNNGNFSDIQREESIVLANDISEEATSKPDDKSAELQVLAELRTKQKEIEEKWLALAKRDSEIKKIDGELDTRLSNITQLEERLERLLGIGRAAQNRRSERVSALAELISSMPPQSGAEIMAKMSDIDAQAILLAIAQKSERKAAKILAMMPSERAAQLGQKYISVEKKLPGSEGLIAHDSAANVPTNTDLPSLDSPDLEPNQSPANDQPVNPNPNLSNDASQKDSATLPPEKSRNP